ncbi:unnamed protein product [Moneuplotes crassus]|uniref:Uncharacterized protein n=1 Tax=Euplotes crassus TaxID=5936 RepID=A0AAD1UHJ4_EUPCR|nr:unnamed protein product [Moneuplotes crassus]
MFVCLLSQALSTKIGFKDGFQLEGTGFVQSEFTNLIDHFDPTDERTYTQRFWYNADAFDFKNGPIFLYICGEYVCGVNEERQFPVKVAQEFNGLFLYLEHRYYGESQPFSDDLETKDLVYLSAKHALADLAVFLTTLNDKIVEENGGQKRKIIVVGGSYPGALSAWFRAKYPHIAEASWASSAVVQAVEDMHMYDYQVYNTTMRSSSSCTQVIQDTTKFFDNLVDEGDRTTLDEIKSYFNAEHYSDADFAISFASSFAGKVQYGGSPDMCHFLETLINSSVFDQFKAIAKDDELYGHFLKAPRLNAASTGRAWHYQYCTEYGYFQTPHDDSPMRSKLLKRPYWDEGCQESFGKDILTQAKATNVHFGSDFVRGSNTFFTNGGEDPWQWVGVTEVYEELNQKSRLIQCEGCAHCVELYNEEEDDADTLKQVRIEIKEWLRDIIYG